MADRVMPLWAMIVVFLCCIALPCVYLAMVCVRPPRVRPLRAGMPYRCPHCHERHVWGDGHAHADRYAWADGERCWRDDVWSHRDSTWK